MKRVFDRFKKQQLSKKLEQLFDLPKLKKVLVKDLAPSRALGITDCFLELEQPKCCSNFFESCCFLKRSKTRFTRWPRAYVFRVIVDAHLIFTFEILHSAWNPSIKKFLQIIENYINYKIYSENIDYMGILLSTIVKATLQLGSCQKPAWMVHYLMFMLYKNISYIFPRNEIA